MVHTGSVAALVSSPLWPTRLLCPWDSPGKNTGVGCHALRQGIFPTQGPNLHLLHCRCILYPLGSPLNIVNIFYFLFICISILLIYSVVLIPGIQRSMEKGTMEKELWRREWQPTPVFMPGEFHEQRNNNGLYRPWGHRESDMTEQLTPIFINIHTHTHTHIYIYPFP